MPKWSFKLAAEMNSKEISPGHWAKLCMFDIGLTHSNKSLRYTLELNNIFNEQSYNYSVFSGINTYSYSYSLRGRELLLSITLTI
jgi:TonB dependent receptor.